MSAYTRFLNPSEAARRLGVSAKALRLYEQRGLLIPGRTAAGWRAYGPAEMAQAAEIVALRALGLSLAQVARALVGDASDLEPALATHQAMLERRIAELAGAVDKVRNLRADLARGAAPAAADLARLTQPATALAVAFDLPWPWGGERFELQDIPALTFITGPLGCGKTRLALRLAETLPGARFLDLDRGADGGVAARAELDVDPALTSRVAAALSRLIEDGAENSGALTALLIGLEAEASAALVVDLVEQGLDQATQQALVAHLRRRGPGARPVFLMTRSNAVLDLDAVGPGEAILYCPANHSPPMRVTPRPGAPGFKAVATCLASPDVRARTEGMRAQMPPAA